MDSFVLDRWLKMDVESQAEFQVRRQKMMRATFTFGAGPRTCIGKNISLLKIYKLIPSLVLRYKLGIRFLCLYLVLECLIKLNMADRAQ